MTAPFSGTCFAVASGAVGAAIRWAFFTMSLHGRIPADAQLVEVAGGVFATTINRADVLALCAEAGLRMADVARTVA